MVCANLSADLLISEHARIVKLVKPSGILVLAGILRSEFSRVARVYRSDGYRLIATRMENEWQGGAFRRGASDEILSGNG
jgi:ribosomal protein L11 methylase PrmA